MSFIDERERAVVDAQFQRCTQLVDQAQWREAQQVCDGILSFIDSASGNLDDDDVRRFGLDWPDDRVQPPLPLHPKHGLIIVPSRCKCT